jgi:hypothetical protein
LPIVPLPYLTFIKFQAVVELKINVPLVVSTRLRLLAFGILS